MSKCREEFNEWIIGRSCTFNEVWQAAWNARGKVDAEIAYETLDDPYLSGHGYATNVKEAIEQENEK